MGRWAGQEGRLRVDQPTIDAVEKGPNVGRLSSSGSGLGWNGRAAGAAPWQRYRSAPPSYAMDAHTLDVGGPSSRSAIVLRFWTIAARWNSFA